MLAGYILHAAQWPELFYIEISWISLHRAHVLLSINASNNSFSGENVCGCDQPFIRDALCRVRNEFMLKRVELVLAVVDKRTSLRAAIQAHTNCRSLAFLQLLCSFNRCKLAAVVVLPNLFSSADFPSCKVSWTVSWNFGARLQIFQCASLHTTILSSATKHMIDHMPLLCVHS